LPTEEQVAAGGGGTPPGTQNSLQVIVRDLTQEERQQLEQSHGVLVERVLPGPAASAGVRDGDVILLINNTKVESVAQFNELMSGLPAGKSIPMLVQRRGNPIFLAFRLGDEG
jgi:serine protease Do